MLRVGLTGSIAVGKSAVSEYFRELGCSVLDADKVAREVVAVGTPGLQQVVRRFGVSVLASDGSLDRARLGQIVFSDPPKLRALNSIVHPLVFSVQDQWLRDCARRDPDGVAIVDAALLIESGGYKRFDKIIVVWCEAAIQFERLMFRDNLTREEAAKRIGAQMSQSQKKRFADHLINTSLGFDDTRKQVSQLYARLKDEARSQISST